MWSFRISIKCKCCVTWTLCPKIEKYLTPLKWITCTFHSFNFLSYVRIQWIVLESNYIAKKKDRKKNAKKTQNLLRIIAFYLKVWHKTVTKHVNERKQSKEKKITIHHISFSLNYVYITFFTDFPFFHRF